MRHLYIVLAALDVALLIGCKAAEPSAPATQTQPPAGEAATRAHALLFELLGDEKNVSKLLIIKRERAELHALVKEIASRSAKAYEQLEAFAKADRQLNLKDTGLPSAEVFTRKAIAKTRGKELLTQNGKEFEVRLLLAQNEALTYGAHLAQVAAGADGQSERGQMLQQLSADLGHLQKQTVDLLLKNYNWPSR